MPNYVAQYQRLDERASSAENKVEEYRERVEHNRWEQCRIAYEAIEEAGEYSQSSFARAVGKSRTTIRNQVWIWAGYGEVAVDRRPSYADAYYEAGGRTREAFDRTRARSAVRQLPPEEKRDIARQLLDDPHVGDDVRDYVRTEQRERLQAHARPDGPLRLQPGRMDKAQRITADLSNAHRYLRDALSGLHDFEPDEDTAEQINRSVGRLRSLIELIALAATGTADIDWDSEFQKLAEVD